MRFRALAPTALAAVLVMASWSIATTGSAQSADFTVSIDEMRYMGNSEACIEFSTNPPQPGATYVVTVEPSLQFSRTGALDANGRGATQHTVEPGTNTTVTVEVTSGDTTRTASDTFVPGPPEDPSVCAPPEGTESPSPSTTTSESPSPSPTESESASPSPSPSATATSTPSPSPSESPTPAPVDDPRCERPRVICGTSGDDRLVGTPNDDVILGGGGNDTIKGRGGDDQLEGGSGGDTINGGRGRDSIKGGPGHDFLKGGRGRDFLNGGTGRDACFGGDGKDRLRSC